MTLNDIVTNPTEFNVLGDSYGFTEGPAADRHGNVYFSDGKNNSIYRWQPGDCPCLPSPFAAAGPGVRAGKNSLPSPVAGEGPGVRVSKNDLPSPAAGEGPGVRAAGSISLFTNDSTDAIGMMFNAQGDLYVCEGAAYRVVAFDKVCGAGVSPAQATCGAGVPPAQTSAQAAGTAAPQGAPSKRILCNEIDGRHFNEPNDLAIDFHGGFYFSDPNYQHRGQPTVMKQDVYYCSAEGRVTRVSTICHKPNGVLLSADDRTLYVADARGQCIYRYDVLGPGQLAGERLWIDNLAANPDGLTLDEYDNLYICCGRAGLKIYDREARFIGRLDIHAANCCFGNADFRTLCIASADKFVGIRTNVTGLKPLSLRVPKKPA